MTIITTARGLGSWISRRPIVSNEHARWSVTGTCILAAGEDAFREAWYLTGPTAAGKTEGGIRLAKLIGAEIISLDSMALYRGLDIGTAKPTPAQRAAVRHHLLDILEPEDDSSVAGYLAAASEAARTIRAAGKRVLFVGGTPLYLKALLRGLFEGPAADWELRESLEAEAREQPPGWLHQRLADVDPQAAARLHPNDTRRLVRALEVHAKTGQPISQFQQHFNWPADEARVFVLEWPRGELYRRIGERVARMFDEGLVAEVEQLLASGRQLGRTARQALGYREVIEHLAGARSLEETIALVEMRTRQFARRQLTWFRSLSECRPVSMMTGEIALTPQEAAEQIVSLAGSLDRVYDGRLTSDESG